MSKKQVLIVTHKLGHNYGGIIQAYALQAYLRQHGLEPTTTNFSYNRLKSRLGRPIKDLLKRVIHIVKPSVSDLPSHYDDLVSLKTQRFIDAHIQVLNDKQKLSSNVGHYFDALITGSDQVWRNIYVPVAKYLFDFADGQKITKLSYAASFGKDDLDEYGPELLSHSKQLAQQFDGISVREDSGVELVRQHWGMSAEHHIDPALLLSRDHYAKLVSEDAKNLTPNQGKIFAYVLDREGDKGKIIDKVSRELKLKEFEILPPKAKNRKQLNNNPELYQLPPVTQWLKGFVDAEFVITDSFHGTAFAIIFNKPFIAIGNKERGLARFTSLLKMFKLENRLVSSASQVTKELINQKIDWPKTNTILANEQKRAHQYLSKHLGLN